MKKEQIKKGDIVVIMTVCQSSPDIWNSYLSFTIYKFKSFNRFHGEKNFSVVDEVRIRREFKKKSGKEDWDQDGYIPKYVGDTEPILNTLIDIDQHIIDETKERVFNSHGINSSSLGIYIEDSENIKWKGFLKQIKNSFKKAINELTDNVEDQVYNIDNPRHINLISSDFYFWNEKEEA